MTHSDRARLDPIHTRPMRGSEMALRTDVPEEANGSESLWRTWSVYGLHETAAKSGVVKHPANADEYQSIHVREQGWFANCRQASTTKKGCPSASSVVRQLTPAHITKYTDYEAGLSGLGRDNPTLLAVDTAGMCRFSVSWPGGGVICPSLAAKKRRAVS